VNVEPQCGEVRLLDEATMLPGGMLAWSCPARSTTPPAPGAWSSKSSPNTCPAPAPCSPTPSAPGPARRRHHREPRTVPLAWFGQTDGEPIATLTAEIDPITDALRPLIGSRQ
jgi:hypothetical protein